MMPPLNDYRNNSRANNSGGGNRQGGYQQRETATITSAPEVKFYTDTEKKNLNAELFTTVAEQTAETIREELNSAQLRRFFGEVKGYYQNWKNNGKTADEFNKLFPLIKMIKSKVYYASNPKKRKIPLPFASFLLGGIDQIKDSKDFEAFVMYFEAVVGFMYGKGMVSK